MMSADVKRT